MQSRQEEAKAKRMGSFDVVGSYTHYNLPRTLAPIVPSSLSPSSSVDTTQDLFSTGVQYSVPLFTGGAMKREVEISNIAQQMSRSRQKLTREELIYNVRSLYLSALSLQELMTAQSSYVEALKTLREKISYGVEYGKRAKIELLKAQNSLQQAKGDLASTRSSLRNVKSTLSAVTHIASIDHIEGISVEVSEPNYQLKQENLDDLERFRVQDLEIAKNKKLVSKVESLKKPQVGLNAYFGNNFDLDQIDPLENENLWQVALNIKWNVFDFGANDAKIQQAKIARLQAKANRDAVSEGFKKLFAKAIGEIEKSYAQYQSNVSSYELSQESQKIEEARYNAGVATINDLLLATSKTALTKAKMIQSRYSYQNGVFYLDYLLERGEAI
jgi:outer membrane protein TolC